MVDKKLSKTKIFIFIIIVIAFLVISYIISKSFASICSSDMTYDKTYKKCIPICRENQTYNDIEKKCKCDETDQIVSLEGKCVANCASDNNICGNKCFSPTFQACDQNSNICNEYTYNENKNLCCKENEFYNTLTKDCDVCGKDVLCGGECCDGNCVSGECCENEHTRKNGTACCKVFAEQGGEDELGKCCDDDQKVSSDNKDCLTKCEGSDGTEYCDFSKGEDCLEIKYYDDNGNLNKTDKKCIKPKHCKITDLTTDPEPVVENGKSIQVCKKQLNHNINDPLAYCNNGDLAGYTKTSTFDVKKEECNAPQICAYIMSQQEGMKSILLDNKKCTGTFSCASSTGTKEECDGSCPYGNNSNRCCKDKSNNYNGLLCREGECINNKCYNGWKIVTKQQKNKYQTTTNTYECVKKLEDDNSGDTTYYTKNECLKGIKKICGEDFVVAGKSMEQLACYRKPPMGDGNPTKDKLSAITNIIGKTDGNVPCGPENDQRSYVSPTVSMSDNKHGYCYDNKNFVANNLYCDSGCFKNSPVSDGCDRARPSETGEWVNGTVLQTLELTNKVVYPYNNDDSDGNVGYCGYPDPNNKGKLQKDPPDLGGINK